MLINNLMPSSVKQLRTLVTELKVDASESSTLIFNDPVFLYRVVPGVCTTSLGVNCAQVAGISRRITARGIISMNTRFFSVRN
jgi:DNA mismatch repair ATPase MutS